MSFLIDCALLIGIPLLTTLCLKGVDHYLDRIPADIDLAEPRESRPARTAPAHHDEHSVCASCGLNVVRYDDRGVCANCVEEGK